MQPGAQLCREDTFSPWALAGPQHFTLFNAVPRHAKSGGVAALSNLYIIVAGSGLVMGRIKTDMVKRTSVKLVKMHAEKFTHNFEKNKDALVGLAEIRSKKLRNVIAGYTVRLKRQGDSPARPKKAYVPPPGGRRDFRQDRRERD